jgi:hypothetical protein
MNPTVIEVETPRGAMPVYLHQPGGDGPFPLVVLYMDGPGIRPALHGHAERLVRAGYAVAMPDLYYAFDPADKPDADKLAAGEGSEFGRMGALVARVNDAASGCAPPRPLVRTSLSLRCCTPRSSSPTGPTHRTWRSERSTRRSTSASGSTTT